MNTTDTRPAVDDEDDLPDMTERDAALVTGTDDQGKAQPVRILTAADILSFSDIKIVPVDVPEWGGMIYVKSMTAIAREKYIESMRQIRGTGKDAVHETILRYGSAKLVALTACDAQGKLLFDRNPDTIEALSRKSALAMERVINASSKLNGLDEEAEKKAAKDAAKKGSADQTAHDSALSID